MSVFFVLRIREEGIRRARRPLAEAKNHPVNMQNELPLRETQGKQPLFGGAARAGGDTVPVAPGIPFSPPNKRDTHLSAFFVLKIRKEGEKTV